MDAICSKNMLWVLEIIEDYMIIDYMELLLRLCWISWIANFLVTKNIGCWVSREFIVWTLTCELVATLTWEILWERIVVMMLGEVAEIITNQTYALC